MVCYKVFIDAAIVFVLYIMLYLIKETEKVDISSWLTYILGIVLIPVSFIICGLLLRDAFFCDTKRMC